MTIFQGKAHDGIPADIIDTVWHSSLQGKDANGWDPAEQLEGGWNATFAILVSVLPHLAGNLAQLLSVEAPGAGHAATSQDPLSHRAWSIWIAVTSN